MSEEEKEVIELLKLTIDFNSSVYTDEISDNDVRTILNLIEKQQKEIEELKEINDEHIEALEEWINGERINDIKHISKDKIREKIKEIQNYTFMSDEEIAQQDYAIERLKELLEENK